MEKKNKAKDNPVSSNKLSPERSELKKYELECKRIEELLKNVQRQRKTILDNIPDIAWLKDKESRFIAVNEPFGRACGFKPEELVGKTDLDVWPAELAERYRADDQEVMGSGERKRLEEPLADKEGKIRWIETIKTPIYNNKGEVIGTTGIARDITERKKLEERLREARAELEIRVRIRTAELSKINEDLRKYVSELRHAEEMLRESESRYRAIIEDQTELVCRFLPDGTITFVNESYCKYFGRTREELLGKNFLPLISEEDRQRVKDNLAFLNQKNPVISHEERVVLPNGQLRWQFWSNRVIFDGDGRLSEIQAVGRDITERKQIEKALRDSELQYRTTIESMSQAIHVVDAGLKITLANLTFRNWSKKLDFTTELVGKTIFEAFPFLSEKVKDEYIQVFQTGEVLITEEANNITGKEVITETRKIPIFEEDKVVRVVTVVEDITERKHWEYTLRESQERYKRIAEAITDFIFTVHIKDGKPTKTTYGLTCVNVTGYTAQEFTADPYLWINMVHKDDRRLVQEYTHRILSGEKGLFLEHRILRKDGALRWVRNTSVPNFDSENKLVFYDGLIQDITERKAVEDRLAKINDCFLSFGTDPLLNINLLTSLCGELMKADCAMYNCIEDGLLCTLGQWNVPAGFNTKDSPQGHICYDVIQKNEDEILVVHDLMNSPYAKTDPNVTRYNLNTYIGYPVRLSGESVGSLCTVYKREFTPTPEDKKIIGIISAAIGVEEERRKVRESLEHRIKFEEITTSISTNFIKIQPEDVNQEINLALETIGRFVGVDRSYIFLINNNGTKVSNVYEWCAEGIEPLMYQLQDISADRLPWFTEKIRKLEAIHIPHLEDFPKEAAAEKEFIEAQGVKSLVIVPMVYGKNPIGLIGFDSVRNEKIWSQESISLLKVVGEIFTNALEHKKAEEAISSGERFLSSIFTSIQDGISVLDKEFNIVSVNPTMEKWYAHYLPLIGKKCFQAYYGREEPCKVCPIVRTIEKGEPANEVVPKVGAGGEIVGWLDLYGFPLLDAATGKLSGAIEYVRDITDRKRAEKKLEILNKELLRSNQRLKQLALRDSQTGLYNHRYLGEVIEAEFYRARRYAHPISVLMLDIDYFKSINDVYGHQFGDLALRQLAKYLKKMVRRYDIIIRFGGEEFIVIFPGTDRATTLVLAQRLLDSMNTYHFGNKEHEVKLKLSMAVVSYPDDKIMKGMDMIELAEQILNKVKESGGNKVYSSVDTKKDKALVASGKKESGNAKFLQDKLEKLNKRANQSLIESVFAFAKTIEAKDHYTGEHVESTVHYATEIASAVNLSKYEIELIKQASMLHDLGKIGISEKILLKSSKLDKKEFDEIKKHPQIGVDIIRPIQFFHNIIPLILYHHERWDGKGYPRGLRGEEIPIGARIIAISDVYQALTSHRPYRKKAFSKEEALKIIKDGAGTQFDPKIVPLFLNIVQKEK